LRFYSTTIVQKRKSILRFWVSLDNIRVLISDVEYLIIYGNIYYWLEFDFFLTLFPGPKKGQMKKKPVPLSRPNSSAGQKTPCEEMAMELKRKHDAVTDREIELRLHVRSKSCDPKQAKQVSIATQCGLH